MAPLAVIVYTYIYARNATCEQAAFAMSHAPYSYHQHRSIDHKTTMARGGRTFLWRALNALWSPDDAVAVFCVYSSILIWTTWNACAQSVESARHLTALYLLLLLLNRHKLKNSIRCLCVNVPYQTIDEWKVGSTIFCREVCNFYCIFIIFFILNCVKSNICHSI